MRYRANPGRVLIAGLVSSCAAALSLDVVAQGVADPQSFDFERILSEAPVTEEKRKKPEKKKDKAGKLDIDALVMLDASRLDGIVIDEDEPVTRTQVRRARFGFRRDIDDELRADLSFDVDDEEGAVEVRRASLRYLHGGGGGVQLGLFKPAFGLENSISSGDLRTLERSMASEAFSPPAGVGLAWSRSHSRFNVEIGAFLDPDEEEAQDVVLRAAALPVRLGKRGRTAVLHLGASARWRKGDDDAYRLRESGGLDGTENVLRSAEFAISGTTTVLAEVALTWKAFSVQGEWMQQTLELDEESADDPRFEGGYVQIAWLFGGARRDYDDGTFERVRSANGLPLELVVNLGRLDARVDGRGNAAEQWSFGANYRLNKSAKLMGHYVGVREIIPDETDEEGDGLVFRMQLEF